MAEINSPAEWNTRYREEARRTQGQGRDASAYDVAQAQSDFNRSLNQPHAPRIPDIEEQLRNAVDVLQDRIDLLGNRLQSVLPGGATTPPDVPGVNAAKLPEVASPLREQLTYRVTAIEAAVNRLQYFISNMEL